MEQKLKKIEKTGIGIMALLCIIIVAGTIILLQNSHKQITEEQNGETDISKEEDYSEKLTETLSFYPREIIIGQEMPVKTFETTDGQEFSMENCRGRYVVLTYWASWCKYCKEQFGNLSSLNELLETYEDVDFYLIDKLDGEKETKEQAETFLAENDLDFSCLYDNGLIAYEAMGIRIVPTTLILDREGRIAFCYAGVLKTESELEAMIAYVREGRDSDTLTFIQEQMMSEDGGIYTNYKDVDDGVPSGHDVLSESQGLMMEYAADTQDVELFENVYSYVKKYMYDNPLPLWVSDAADSVSTNALLDDLRMLKALAKMQEQTGGYREDVKKLAEAIAIYDTEQQSPVDFYDFKNSQKSSTFTLCYADFTALEIVAKMSVAAEKLPENALTIVENGYIGEEFPFYYNSYSYEDGTYDTSSLNMAEALYTLYHLAEAGKLKDSSLAWLQTHMEDNGIFARYDVQGNVVPGYEYESPAIYALVGLIAQETGEEKLLTQALSRMEEWRVFDTEDTANGAFGTQGIGQMMSYDQCMALLLYGKIEGQGV